MTFDEILNELVDEVEVPDELLPENIALMLKEKTAQSDTETIKRNTRTVSSASAQRRSIIMRTAAATAACAVFAAGMISYSSRSDDETEIEEQIDYAAVSPENYDDLYNMYTGIFLDGKNSGEDDDGEKTEKNTAVDTPVITDTEPVPEETLADIPMYDFSGIDDPRVSEADIVKSDGKNLYCITDSRLYVISLETMEVVSEIENKLNPPVELYIEGDTLVLVSKENEEVQVVERGNAAETSVTSSDNSAAAADVPASGTDTYSKNDDNGVISGTDGSGGDNKAVSDKTNVVVDIYDIGGGTSPVHITTYKQNGGYISSRIADGILYVVTSYSDYRTAPLDKVTSLDTFVPAYYIDGEKRFVAASDITVPSNANSTDYTVLSAIDCSGEKASLITVKAVLGSSKNVYCSADSLYIAGSGRSETNDSITDYSVITSFDLSKSEGMTYRASGSVAGRVINQYSMNENNGLLRVAAAVSDGASTSIYVLDSSLTVVNSAGQILPGEDVSAVRFEENYANVYTDDSEEPAIVLDLTTNPITQTQSATGNSSYLRTYSEDKLLGFGKTADGSALSLKMYNADTGLALSSLDFAEGLADVSSDALYDKRALLIDKDNGIIGVPVYSHNEFATRNQYYIFEYGDEGFALKGTIEYNDIDDSMIFERAEVENGILYIIGGKRIISVQLSDLKVINSFEF